MEKGKIVTVRQQKYLRKQMRRERGKNWLKDKNTSWQVKSQHIKREERRKRQTETTTKLGRNTEKDER